MIIIDAVFEIKGTIQSQYLDNGKIVKIDEKFPEDEISLVNFRVRLLMFANAKEKGGKINYTAKILGYVLPELSFEEFRKESLVNKYISTAHLMNSKGIKKGTLIEI